MNAQLAKETAIIINNIKRNDQYSDVKKMINIRVNDGKFFLEYAYPLSKATKEKLFLESYIIEIPLTKTENVCAIIRWE